MRRVSRLQNPPGTIISSGYNPTSYSSASRALEARDRLPIARAQTLRGDCSPLLYTTTRGVHLLTCPAVSKGRAFTRPADFGGKRNAPIPSVTDKQAYPGPSGRPTAGATLPYPSPIPRELPKVRLLGTPEGLFVDPASSSQIPINECGVTQPAAYRLFVEGNATDLLQIQVLAPP